MSTGGGGSPWPPPKAASDADLLTLELSVDAYYVNIGTGDSTIYYLIQHPPANSLDRRPFVHRAVLIDGGKGPGGQRIRDFLGRVPDLYHFEKTQGERVDLGEQLKFPPFDSIVITHWDIDHFAGVNELIRKHMDEAVTPGNEDTIAAEYLSPYMKYGPKEKGTNNGGISKNRGSRAQTTLCAPYWTLDSADTRNYRFQLPKFPRSSRMGVDQDPNGTMFRGDGITMYWEFEASNLPKKDPKNKYRPMVKIPRICKFRAGFRNLSGMNLFTGLRPFTHAQALKLSSPQDLAYFHRYPGKIPEPSKEWPVLDNVAPDKAWPVLAIVAGLDENPDKSWVLQCCGDKATGRSRDTEMSNLTTLSASYATLTAVQDAEPETELEDDIKQAVLKRREVQTAPKGNKIGESGDTAKVEAPDIARLAHQKPSGEVGESDETGTQEVEMSPGDFPIRPMIVDEPTNTRVASEANNMVSLISEGELGVAAWVQKNTAFKSVRTVKLQHHGSADSTPIALLRSFKPRSIIVSADTNKYGHPRPEVLMWLYLWWKASVKSRIVIGRDNKLLDTGFLRSNVYPYWLEWVAGTSPHYNKNKPKDRIIKFDYFTGNKIPYAAYQAALTNLSSLMKVADPNLDYYGGIKTIIDKSKTTNDKIETVKAKIQEYVQKLVEGFWPYFSDVAVECLHGDTVEPQSRGKYRRVRNDERVLFVKSFCRPNDVERRRRGDGYFDGYAIPFRGKDTNKELLNWSECKLPEEPKPMDIDSAGGPKVEEMVVDQPLAAATAPAAKDAIAKDYAQGIKRQRTDSGIAGDDIDDTTIINPNTGKSGGIVSITPKKPKVDNEKFKAEIARRARTRLRDAPSPPPPASPDRDYLVILIPKPVAPYWSPDPATVLPIYQIAPHPDVPTDFFSIFVSLLDTPALVVNTDDTLAPLDSFRTWLLLATRAPDTSIISVNWGGTQAQSIIHELRFCLAPTSECPEMIFSTATHSLLGNFSDRAQADFRLPASGYFPFFNFLVFGLTPEKRASSQTWNLAQVFRQLNVATEGDLTTYGEVLQLIIEQLLDIEFKLERGVIWFSPLENYKTTLRLEWGLSQSHETTMREWCQSWMPETLTIQNIKVVGRRNCRLAIDVPSTPDATPTSKAWRAIHDHEMMVIFEVGKDDRRPGALDDVSITCGLDLQLASGATSLTAIVRLDPANESATAGLVDTLDWLVGQGDIGGALSDLASVMPFLDNIQLRSVQLKMSQLKTVDMITVDAELWNDDWKVEDENGTELTIPLKLTYKYTKGLPQPHSFSASVWFEYDDEPWVVPQIMPEYEEIYAMKPWRKSPGYLSLESLMPNGGSYTLPPELDLAITNLRIGFEGNKISFTGALRRVEDPSAPNSSLGINLSRVDLAASFTFADSSTRTPDKSSYKIELETEFIIAGDPDTPVKDIEEYEPPDDGEGENGEVAIATEGNTSKETPSDEPSMLACTITFESVGNTKSLRLFGSADWITLGEMVRFFPGDDAAIVRDSLGHIIILRFDLEYNYHSTTGTATDFSINGELLLGDLRLNLAFVRDQVGWTFDATVKIAEVGLTIEKLLREVVDPQNQDAVDDLPGFVRNIDISKASLRLSLKSEKAVTAVTGNPPVAAQPGTFVTCIELDIPGPENTMLSLAFLQITNKAVGGTAPGATASATKRLIKTTLNTLPWNKLPKIPVVDRIQPAFDELGFYWVQDPTWKNQAIKPGMTRAEVQKLNEISPVLFKEKSAAMNPATDPQAASMVVLDAGMHFMIIDAAGAGQAQSKIHLDYLFNKPRFPSPAALASREGDFGLLAAASTEPTGTAKGTLEKKLGPFEVSNVGVRFENGELVIYLDIYANLGPIKLALMGFGIGMDLSTKTLQDVVTHVPTLHLQGMGVEFNQPPVGITGMFMERKIDTSTMYVGGLALTIEPYSFMAVGAYGEVQKPNSTAKFKTVFMFAKLEGPLIELGFITIGGICLGFGYNSDIRFPSIQEIPTFPLIANSSLPTDNPLKVMSQLVSTDPRVGVVTPRDGSYWLAAGLQAKALHLLDVTAVVVFEFNPYVSMGIFAKAIAQMPPAPTPREACFVFVELGIKATVDFHAGAVRIEAGLSPNSFVIAPSCHLTGGFALCYWFPPSGYAGDFVFSIGGYHSAFKPPPHYPVPQRLAISWRISSDLSITGEGYFAITPKACMGGGRLSAVFNQGLLHAWLTAYADFLIEYHPFSILAVIGLSVGVKFTLDLLFICIEISVSIAAQLTLWGTPFGGEVYVDFYIFGFTVGFGDSKQEQAISIDEFFNLLTQVPDADALASSGSSALVDKLHVISVEKGLNVDKAGSGDSQTKPGDIWEVHRGGFVFRVQSRVPLQAIDATPPGSPKVEVNNGQRTAVSSSAPFYAKPMHLQSQLESKMTVTVSEADGEPIKFILQETVTKQLPLALWGHYDPNNAPGRGINNISSLLDPAGGSTELMVGASFGAPPSEISEDKIVPIDVVASSSLDVFQPSDPLRPVLNGDVVIQDSTIWSPAKPTAGPEQWATVKAQWMNPDIVIPRPPSDTLPSDGNVAQAPPTTREVTGETEQPPDAGEDRGDIEPPPPTAEEPVEPAEPLPPVEAYKDVVDVAMELWSSAFEWAFDPSGGAPQSNQLRNEVSAKHDDVLVWKEFEDQYMAAPFIGVPA
ncbi:hypothetical protein ANO14919_088590 [Xylariales sp. No.14919]|nr:hypothetical protein ANO14919_088590 [Xylariales sp. No.14919]